MSNAGLPALLASCGGEPVTAVARSGLNHRVAVAVAGRGALVSHAAHLALSRAAMAGRTALRRRGDRVCRHEKRGDGASAEQFRHEITSPCVC